MNIFTQLTEICNLLTMANHPPPANHYTHDIAAPTPAEQQFINF